MVKKTFWCKCSVAGGGCGSQARVEEGSTVQMFSGWRRVCGSQARGEGGSTVTEGDVCGGGGQSSVK